MSYQGLSAQGTALSATSWVKKVLDTTEYLCLSSYHQTVRQPTFAGGKTYLIVKCAIAANSPKARLQ